MHEPIEDLRKINTECVCGACTLRVVVKLVAAGLAVGVVGGLAAWKLLELLT